MVGTNKTTAGVTTLGGAIAVIVVIILGLVGVVLQPEVSAVGTAALAIIFNRFIPEKK